MDRRPVSAPAPAGIVLAGGAGRRMGTPKAAVHLAGRPLVQHALALLGARCAQVVVVARPETPLGPLPAPVVHDRPGPAGPLGALATGLAAVDADRVLVLACDLPFAAPLLDALLAHPGEGAVVGRSAGHIQPLCARYPRRATLAEAERLLGAGDHRARGPALALDAATIDDRWGALANLNTPDDLRLAAARWADAQTG